MIASDEQIVKAIGDFIKKKGFSPTLREVGEAIGISSTGSVKYRLGKLRDRGLITFDDGKPRTLRVVNNANK